ncbi:MAG: hypothetical protein OEQ29_19360, partial [Alphaproteobacteria bacterium]|nr:hypothetical protein [Alphaproteobacteria bacterium]
MKRLASVLGRQLRGSPYAGAALVAVGALLLIGAVIAVAGFNPVAVVVSLLSQSLGTLNGITEV